MEDNKIDYEQFIKGTEEDAIITVDGVEVRVTPAIEFGKIEAIISTAVENYFNDGEYQPEIGDIATKILILSFYTNIKMPETVEEMYALITYTTLFDDVSVHINSKELDFVLNAIYNRVDCQKSILFGSEDASNKMILVIDDIIDKFNKSIDTKDIDEMKNMISELRYQNGSNK